MKVKVPTTGLEIEYEAHGDPSHPAFLCVMGLGGALTIWRPSFVQRIVDLGYYVIRCDNSSFLLQCSANQCRRHSLPWRLLICT